VSKRRGEPVKLIEIPKDLKTIKIATTIRGVVYSKMCARIATTGEFDSEASFLRGLIETELDIPADERGKIK